MKRTVLILVALIFLSLTLVACGAASDVENSPQGNNEESENPSPESEEPIKLVFLRSGDEGEKNIVGPQIKAFTKETGIEVDMVMVPWGQGFQKMMTMVGSGNAPDVTYTGSRYIPSLAEMGAIIPIDVPAERQDEYTDSIWGMVTWNGEIYGIPRAFSSKVLYYNKDLFEQAGLDPNSPPTTWEELESSAKAISENTDAYGFALAGAKFVSTTSQFFNFLYQNGGAVMDAEGNIIINNPEAVEALEFYTGLAQYSEPGPTAHQREDLWELFAAEKVGMYISGPWRRAAFMDAGIDFGVADLPSGPQGSSSTILVSDSLIVFSQSKNTEAAQQLALFLTSRENQEILDTTWGMTPARSAEAELPFFQDDPTWKPFLDMVPKGKAQPLVEDWNLLEDALTDAIQSVLLGELDAQTALDRVALKLGTAQ
ncbi:MAG: sugar ABC transporter substrate-binding protein [Anaerolineaceae bacterium]|nr:sugar ABC transporter substrate-binding protein [Anaerolineaceae bacterium]